MFRLLANRKQKKAAAAAAEEEKKEQQRQQQNKMPIEERMNGLSLGGQEENDQTNGSGKHKRRASSRFHPPDLENSSRALYAPINPTQFGWSMKNATSTSGGWITETQTFYTISDAGELVYIQLAYSNLSWPAQTICQISARYFDPVKGINKFGTWTVPASKLKLDSQKTSCSARSTSFTQISSSSSPSTNTTTKEDMIASFRVKHGSEDETLSATSTITDASPLILDLAFDSASEPFAIHDGCIHFGTNRNDGYIQLKFIPAARVSGTVKYSDGNQSSSLVERSFGGWGFVVRQFQGLKPYLSASRWNLFYFCSDQINTTTTTTKTNTTTLFMIQLITPEPYDRITYNIGCIWQDGKLLAVSVDNSIGEVDVTEDPESKYRIPRAFQYRWNGTTFSGEPIQASCLCEPRTVVTKECVLDSLPFVLRKVIEAFIPRPYIYQWADRATVEVSIGTSSQRISGWCFQELSLISSDQGSGGSGSGEM